MNNKLQSHHIKVRDAANQFYRTQVKKAMQERRQRFVVEEGMLISNEAFENADIVDESDAEMDIAEPN